MKLRSVPPVALVLASVAVLLVRPAFGYLDPGTGSYIMQLLIGGFLGGLFAIGLFWKRVMAFIRRIFSPRGKDSGSGN